jgi:hypothetical protein
MNGKTAKFIRKSLNYDPKDAESIADYQEMKRKWNETPRNRRGLLRGQMKTS